MLKEKQIIKLKNGQEINTQIWENGSPVWLVVTHGLGEHGERHDYMYKLFSQYFNILTYDLRGHGKSAGRRGYVDEFSEYTDDLSCLLEHLQETYKMDRFILFGHSMGGLITAKWVQDHHDDELYPEKIYLSSPPVAAPGLQGRFFQYSPTILTETLKNIPFSTPLGGLLDLKKLSHDPRVYESYIKDPDNVLKIETKLLLNVVHASRTVFCKPLRAKTALYVSVGTEDVLVHPKALIEYFEGIEKNARLLKVEGGWHEMHNEIVRYNAPYFEFLKESLMGALYS